MNAQPTNPPHHGTIDWKAIREESLGGSAIFELPPKLTLPALPLAVTQFVERSSNPGANLRELGRVVETDSGLTVELLKHVNSTFLGLPTKVRSAQQALSTLGMRASRNLILSVGMRASIQARQSKLINQNCFWNACLQKALFARQLAALLGADQELAFAGALLQDFLLPVLTNDLFDEYLAFVRDRPAQTNLLCEFEQQCFGWDHAFAGAMLAFRWKLPDDLVCCILYHHQGPEILDHPQLGRSSAAAVALAALLPDQLRQCYDGLEQLRALERRWPAFRMDEIVATVDRVHAESGMGVRNDFPLARRCRSVLTVDADNADGTLRSSALVPACAAT